MLKTKIAAVAFAALTLAGSVAASTTQAEAKWKGGPGLGFGIAAGIIAGAAIASAAHAQPAYVDYGYRRCRFVQEVDAYGYVRTVRLCKVYPY